MPNASRLGRLRSLTALTALLGTIALPAHAGDAVVCTYTAYLKAWVPNKAMTRKIVFLDVVETSAEVSERARRKAAYDFVTRNFQVLGLKSIDHLNVGVMGNCKDPTVASFNRTMNLLGAENEKADPTRRIDAVVALHGVWLEGARKTSADMRTERAESVNALLPDNLSARSGGASDTKVPAAVVDGTTSQQRASESAESTAASAATASATARKDTTAALKNSNSSTSSPATSAESGGKDAVKVAEAAMHPLTPALIEAVSKDNREEVQRLLSLGAPVDGTVKGELRPIKSAIIDGNTAMVSLLLAAGARLEGTPSKTLLGGDRPLICSSINRGLFGVESGSVPVFQLLLAAGASPDTECMLGSRVLHNAASSNRYEMVRLLLAAGADVDAPNANGWRPLDLAASEGHVETVRMLLEGGARTDFRNEDGIGVFDRVGKENREQVLALLRAAPPGGNGKRPKRNDAEVRRVEVAKLMNLPATAEAFGYSCNQYTMGYPERYDDLENPARARSNWNKARQLAGQYRQCVSTYIGGIGAQPLDKRFPAIAWMNSEQRDGFSKKAGEAMENVAGLIRYGNRKIAEEMEDVQASQGRMTAAADARERAVAETRAWMREISNELAAAPAKMEYEMKRLQAALRGTTVEEEEARARQAAQFQLMLYEAQSGDAGDGKTDDATSASSSTSSHDSASHANSSTGTQTGFDNNCLRLRVNPNLAKNAAERAYILENNAKVDPSCNRVSDHRGPSSNTLK